MKGSGQSGQTGSRVRQIRSRVLLGSGTSVPATRRSCEDGSRVFPRSLPQPEIQTGLHRNHQSCVRPVCLPLQQPTTLNRQHGDVGTQYRSGIYYYNEVQARLAQESLEEKQKELKDKIVAEILPAKTFYRAEEFHQQYLEKGEGSGSKQCAAKGCNDPIRCYV